MVDTAARGTVRIARRRAPSVDIPHILLVFVYVEILQVAHGDGKSDVLQGTLDLMVLKTLESMGSRHGYAIARRIEEVSGHTVIMNQGTIYPALLRLQQRKWINAEWGVSETGRRAKFYSLSKLGREKIATETEDWERVASTMARFLAPST
jgi:PadR family transcriptional regulator, regulatory protein PadR